MQLTSTMRIITGTLRSAMVTSSAKQRTITTQAQSDSG